MEGASTLKRDFPWRRTLSADTLYLLSFALGTFVLHLVINALGGYGIFRDELYYLACADHLDFGYVDQPPLSMYVLTVSRLLFGDSLFAIRIIPACMGATVVFLSGVMAKELGGGRVAQTFAALGVLVSPVILSMTTFYSMNALDFVFWSLASLMTIRLLKTGDPSYWLALGLVLGLGALNKIDILWWAAGIAAGLGLTRHRTWLFTRWPYVAMLIAVLVFAPYPLWNLLHDFAHIEFIKNATSGKYSGLTGWTFVVGQFLTQNPFSAVLWIGGLVFLLVSRQAALFRPLGIAYLVALAILLVNQHSKPEYLAPAYPLLFAAGGAAIERFTTNTSARWLRAGYAVLLLASGVALAPFAIPVLPVEAYIHYADRLGIAPGTAEGKALDRLPQFYADMFGWPEKAAAVAAAFQRLTPEERTRCAIFADNYGRCGAIDYYGRHYGLPKSIGSHNNYWIWGPGEYTGELMMILGGNLRDKQKYFEQVEAAGTVSSPYCMPYENALTIYLCRGLRRPLPELWKTLKHYD